MRTLVFLLLLNLLCLPVLANEEDAPVLPFAYVTMQEYTETTWANYDLHVMDAANGALLYEFTTEENECPISISPDEQWLSFTRGSMNESSLYLLNIMSGEERIIPNNASRISFRMSWSQKGRWLAYTRTFDHHEQLFVYDTTEQNEYYLSDAPILPLYWIDETLVYGTIEDETLTIHHWQGEALQTSSFPAPEQAAYWLSFSPNMQSFLALTIDNNNETRLLLYEASSLTFVDLGIFNANTLVWLGDGFRFVYSLRGYSALYIYDIRTKSSELFAANERIYSGLSLSPDGQYLLYRQYHEGGTYNNAYSFAFINIETHQETSMRNRVDAYNQSGEFAWLSDSQVIYSYSYSENDFNDPDINDIYRYDMTSRETIQLTATPEIHEMFYCEWG